MCSVCSTHGLRIDYEILVSKLRNGRSLWGHCIGLNLRIILNWTTDKSIANIQLDRNHCVQGVVTCFHGNCYENLSNSSPLSNSKVKNEWSYTSTPPNAFMSTLPLPYYQRLKEGPVKGLNLSVSLLVRGNKLFSLLVQSLSAFSRPHKL
jgi:hypothetical protein